MNGGIDTGKLIVIEGIDGSGKSTQVKLLIQDMKAAGLAVRDTKWKDSAYIGDLFIGDLLQRINTGEAVIPPEARSFLLGADLSHRMEATVKPTLASGVHVIGDRWTYKVIAQGVARGLSLEWIKPLFHFAVEPDVKIVIDVPSIVASERILAYRDISFYEAGLDVNPGKERAESFIEFQGKVRAAMLELARQEEMTVIDGTQSVEEQHRQVLDLVNDALGLELECLGHDGK